MKCLVCANEISDPWWPICSNPACFLILTQIVVHKETSCWISQEVYCQREYCVNLNDKCVILKLDQKLKEQEQKRSETVLNCWY